MSKLVEKYQNSCIRLTNIMERNVVDYVDTSSTWIVPSRDKFNTDCNEFQNFIKKVNSDTNNNITIKVKYPSCDFIKTEVDLKKRSVTYTLS